MIAPECFKGFRRRFRRMSIAEFVCNLIVDTGRGIPVFASETRSPLRATPQGS